MLEEDYVALEKQTAIGQSNVEENKTHTVASQVVREIVIPEIEKEVNQGQNFAPLRQMFYSMILASWYKIALKDALLNQVYSNKGKTAGVLSDDPAVKDKIYQQYLQAYKKGVFNYIKEEMDAVSQQPMPRKYFSGGLAPDLGVWKILERAPTPSSGDDLSPGGDMAMATVNVAKSGATAGAQGTGSSNAGAAVKGLMTALKDGAVIEANDTGSWVTINLTPGVISSVRKLLAIVNPVASLAEGELKADEVAGIQEKLKKLFGTQVTVAKGGKSLSFETPLSAEMAKQQFDLAMKAGVPDRAWIGILEFNMAAYSFAAEPSSILNMILGLVLSFLSAKDFFKAYVELSSNQNAEEPNNVYLEFIKHNARVTPREDGNEGSVVTLPRPKEKPISEEDWTGMMDALIGVLEVSGANEYAVAKGTNELVITTSMVKSEIDRKISDMAMDGVTGARVQTGDPLGGIDLNAKNMGLDIAKDGKGIQMKFDPAMVAEFQKGNFSGVEGIILRIVPIQSPLPMLGLETSPAEGALAKG